MPDQPDDAPRLAKPSFARSWRVRAAAAAVLAIVAGAAWWLWTTRGRESTDDAQVDSYVTPIAARVGGTVLRVSVVDNQLVDAGATLVEIDPRDYEVSVEKARADLADAEAAAIAAQSNVPITFTTASSNVTTARGSVDQAHAAADAAQKEVEAARARLTTSQAKAREANANAAKAARDVERLKGLLAKDEVSQQQFDAVSAQAEAQQAAADSAISQVAEAEAGIRVAESRLVQARAGETEALSSLRGTETEPEQLAAMKARASSAEARVLQAKASLAQAELNLQYTTVKAPARGIVSKKSVNPGQVVQPDQPLLAIVETGTEWITANYKETQLTNMRAGQRAVVDVDGLGGKSFEGHVDSIAAATGARFSLLPPENATGNFVKVVQRVPVKIVLDTGQDPDQRLRPGMSVTPTVYTR
jgi:membrane fusion protein (multidrug efflux system)